MNTKHKLLSVRRVIYSLILMLTAGCGKPIMEWSEQVKLQSGEVIVVARTAKFKKNWIAGGGGGSINEGMTLQFAQPVKPDNPSLWSARFVPILLDRDLNTKEWFIVATFIHCDSWYELGRPKLPYTEYRYRNGQWVQQPLTPSLIGRDANVFPIDPSRKGVLAEEQPALSVERKDGMFFNPAMSPRFKRIVDNWPSGANC